MGKGPSCPSVVCCLDGLSCVCVFQLILGFVVQINEWYSFLLLRILGKSWFFQFSIKTGTYTKNTVSMLNWKNQVFLNMRWTRFTQQFCISAANRLKCTNTRQSLQITNDLFLVDQHPFILQCLWNDKNIYGFFVSHILHEILQFVSYVNEMMCDVNWLTQHFER